MRERPISGLGRLGRNPVGDAILHRRNTEALARLAAICERHIEPQQVAAPRAQRQVCRVETAGLDHLDREVTQLAVRALAHGAQQLEGAG